MADKPVEVTARFFVNGENGYEVGGKTFRSWDKFKEAVQKAFGKTMVAGEQLSVQFCFTSETRGAMNFIMDSSDYTEIMSKAETLATTDRWTIETLLS